MLGRSGPIAENAVTAMRDMLAMPTEKTFIAFQMEEDEDKEVEICLSLKPGDIIDVHNEENEEWYAVVRSQPGPGSKGKDLSVDIIWMTELEHTPGEFVLSAWTDRIELSTIKRWGSHTLNFDLQSRTFRKPAAKPVKVKSLEEMDRTRDQIMMFISRSVDDEFSSIGREVSTLLELLFPVIVVDFFDNTSGERATIHECPA